MSDSKQLKSSNAELYRFVDLPPISNEAKAAIANIIGSSSKSALMQFINPELSADDMRSIARHALRTASEDEPDAHYRAALSYIANISQTADDMRATAHSALNRLIIRSKTKQTALVWGFIDSSAKPLLDPGFIDSSGRFIIKISNSGELSFGDGVTASEAATAFLEAHNEQFKGMKKENERLKALLSEQNGGANG